jgi:hypothetical protein
MAEVTLMWRVVAADRGETRTDSPGLDGLATEVRRTGG